MIVESLRTYGQPVIVYLPPGTELRGGAWVVIDGQINAQVLLPPPPPPHASLASAATRGPACLVRAPQAGPPCQVVHVAATLCLMCCSTALCRLPRLSQGPGKRTLSAPTSLHCCYTGPTSLSVRSEQHVRTHGCLGAERLRLAGARAAGGEVGVLRGSTQTQGTLRRWRCTPILAPGAASWSLRALSRSSSGGATWCRPCTASTLCCSSWLQPSLHCAMARPTLW